MKTYRIPARAVRAVPGVFAFFAAVLGTSAASSQAVGPLPPSTNGQPAPEKMYEYAVKFVCGRSVVLPHGQQPPAVAVGFYFTAINVHNPNSESLEFQKKFARAMPNQESVKPSRFFPAKLDADHAFEVDCPEIIKNLELPPLSFAKGFVVFQSKRELDIVAVYTSAASPAGTVITMALERVPKR